MFLKFMYMKCQPNSLMIYYGCLGILIKDTSNLTSNGRPVHRLIERTCGFTFDPLRQSKNIESGGGITAERSFTFDPLHFIFLWRGVVNRLNSICWNEYQGL
ncbi:hypothetical protein MKW98_003035, partial [Papaver atlanticum]